MTRNGLLAILRIAILCFAPLGTHAQDAMSALPDAELAGAVRQSLVQRRLLETASGRFPGSSGDKHVRRIGSFESAVALHVKAVAAFGACFLLLAAWAWLHRARYPWLVRGCAGLLVILAAQMAIGETQYRLYGSIPWAVVLLHVAVAASLFAWAVGLVTRVWRPIRN